MAVLSFSSSVVLILLSAFVISQVRGKSIEKRSDDDNPLVAVVEQLSSRVSQLETQVQTNTNNLDDVERAVAFSLRLSQETVTGLAHGQTIKFDNILMNAGNGYSPLTGAFTVPASGTYVFYLQTLNYNTDTPIWLDIMKDGQFLARAIASNSDDENGSTMVAAHLNQGNVIHVQVAHGSSFWGGVYTAFVGFRISPLKKMPSGQSGKSTEKLQEERNQDD